MRRYGRGRFFGVIALLTAVVITGCGFLDSNVSEGRKEASVEEQFETLEKVKEKKKSVRKHIGKKKTICIDPGHQVRQNSNKESVGPGSKERKQKVSSGTAGVVTKVPEYKLNMVVSLKLKKELEYRGYRVVMTRMTDQTDISNKERAEIANNAKADAYIRIHADGAPSASYNGVATYCMTKENPYNSYLYKQSYRLSNLIVTALAQSTGAKNNGVTERDTYTGNNWSKVPVTIVEMGFMSNPKEDRQMQTRSYQKKIVVGIANGVDRYLKKS